MGSYERFTNELDKMIHVNPVMTENYVLFGKNNWLFLQKAADGNAYHDYIGDNAFSETELLQIKNNLLEEKKVIEEEGSKFVLMIIPNKEIIYAENMSSYVDRVSDVTRTDKLVEYLRVNTDLTIIYPKDVFSKSKKNNKFTMLQIHTGIWLVHMLPFQN